MAKRYAWPKVALCSAYDSLSSIVQVLLKVSRTISEKALVSPKICEKVSSKSRRALPIFMPDFSKSSE